VVKVLDKSKAPFATILEHADLGETLYIFEVHLRCTVVIGHPCDESMTRRRDLTSGACTTGGPHRETGTRHKQKWWGYLGTIAAAECQSGAQCVRTQSN